MDPDRLYWETHMYMKDGLYEQARNAAIELRNWLDKGGFYPLFYSHQEVNNYLASVLRRTTYYEAI